MRRHAPSNRLFCRILKKITSPLAIISTEAMMKVFAAMTLVRSGATFRSMIIKALMAYRKDARVQCLNPGYVVPLLYTSTMKTNIANAIREEKMKTVFMLRTSVMVYP